MIPRLLILTTILFYLGCAEAPTCQTNSEQNTPKGNAGCWLSQDNKLLMVQQSNELFSFPGGMAGFNESAKCTAHRETWEEAGINVVVGDLKHQFDNGFYLFECFADNLTLATNDSTEVKKVVLIEPEAIPTEQWRYPKQRLMSIDWLQEGSN